MRTQQFFRGGFFLMLLALLSGGAIQAQNGKVFGTATLDGEPLMLTEITLQQGETIIQRGMSDMAGKYKFAVIPPGEYSIVVRDGEDTYTFGLTMGSDETEIKDLTIAKGGSIYPTDELFSVDPIQPVTIPISVINQGSVRSPEDIAATLTPGITQRDQGDPLNMRGARSGGTVYFVNGIKVRGETGLPMRSMEQIDVITGGVPASIGDAAGGVILVETRGGMRGSGGKYYSREERREMRRRKKGKDKDSFHINGQDILALQF